MPLLRVPTRLGFPPAPASYVTARTTAGTREEQFRSAGVGALHGSVLQRPRATSMSLIRSGRRGPASLCEAVGMDEVRELAAVIDRAHRERRLLDAAAQDPVDLPAAYAVQRELTAPRHGPQCAPHRRQAWLHVPGDARADDDRRTQPRPAARHHAHHRRPHPRNTCPTPDRTRDSPRPPPHLSPRRPRCGGLRLAGLPVQPRTQQRRRIPGRRGGARPSPAPPHPRHAAIRSWTCASQRGASPTTRCASSRPRWTQSPPTQSTSPGATSPSSRLIATVARRHVPAVCAQRVKRRRRPPRRSPCG